MGKRGFYIVYTPVLDFFFGNTWFLRNGGTSGSVQKEYVPSVAWDRYVPRAYRMLLNYMDAKCIETQLAIPMIRSYRNTAQATLDAIQKFQKSS